MVQPRRADPFLTFFTPTHRPEKLARCMAAVQSQSVAEFIEHVIVPDYVMRGIVESLYGGCFRYAPAFHGSYVHILGDDDVLASSTVVEELMLFVKKVGNPPVVVANVQKGRARFPQVPVNGPPVETKIDMASYVMRRDIYQRHRADYGDRYAGDFDHARALWKAHYSHVHFDRLFVVGGSTAGRTDFFVDADMTQVQR